MSKPCVKIGARDTAGVQASIRRRELTRHLSISSQPQSPTRPAFAMHELRGPNTVPACSYLVGPHVHRTGRLEGQPTRRSRPGRHVRVIARPRPCAASPASSGADSARGRVGACPSLWAAPPWRASQPAS